MNWKEIFGVSPVDHGRQLAKISNHMQKVAFENTFNAEQVRILFSNLYSAEPLTLESVAIGTKRDGKSLASAQVTKDGKSRIQMEAGEEFFSDEIALPVRFGEQIEVFIYIKQEQSIGSVCLLPLNCGVQVINDWPKERGREVFYGFSSVQALTEE